jgi:hypothetical protein
LLLGIGEKTEVLDADTLVLSLESRSPAEINHFLVGHGIAVEHLAREQASLEALFFDLTVGRALSEAA